MARVAFVMRLKPGNEAICKHDEIGPDTRPEPYDPILLRGWKMMEPYMDYNPDGTPWQQPIEGVFHAD